MERIIYDLVVEYPRHFTTFAHTNEQGEVCKYKVIPRALWYGTVDAEKEAQWFLNVRDITWGDYIERDFALKDITELKQA